MHACLGRNEPNGFSVTLSRRARALRLKVLNPDHPSLPVQMQILPDASAADEPCRQNRHFVGKCLCMEPARADVSYLLAAVLGTGASMMLAYVEGHRQRRAMNPSERLDTTYGTTHMSVMRWLSKPGSG